MIRMFANWVGVVLLIVFAAGCGGGGSGGAVTVAPSVSSTTPASSATGAATNSVITATFSKSMDPATIDATTFTVAGVTGTVSYDVSSKTATFKPFGLTGNATYTATISTRAKDLSGNPMAANYAWSFNTQADTTPPTVVATTPALNGSVATNSAITVAFSEAMDPATINTPATTFTLSGPVGSVTGTVSYDATNKIATFKPSADLTASSTYTATVTTGVKDLAGNTMAAAYTWAFTTGTVPDASQPTVSSTIPASNAAGIPINSAILVEFNKDMDAASITTTTFTIAGVTGTVFLTTPRIAIFWPSSNFTANTTYTATITTGVKNLEGNPMTTNHSWTFTTGLTTDTAAPQVISVSPQAGATNVAVNSPLSVTFNEPVIPFTVGLIGGKAVVVSFDAAKTTVTMTPTVDLQHSALYSATIQARDLCGNPVLVTWAFTTQ